MASSDCSNDEEPSKEETHTEWFSLPSRKELSNNEDVSNSESATAQNKCNINSSACRMEGSLSQQIVDYYKMYGKNREIEQYFTVPIGDRVFSSVYPERQITEIENFNTRESTNVEHVHSSMKDNLKGLQTLDENINTNISEPSDRIPVSSENKIQKERKKWNKPTNVQSNKLTALTVPEKDVNSSTKAEKTQKVNEKVSKPIKSQKREITLNVESQIEINYSSYVKPGVYHTKSIRTSEIATNTDSNCILPTTSTNSTKSHAVEHKLHPILKMPSEEKNHSVVKPQSIITADLSPGVDSSRIVSPSSSIASNKRLEWDSLADVGYTNVHQVRSDQPLSTIERIAIEHGEKNHRKNIDDMLKAFNDNNLQNILIVSNNKGNILETPAMTHSSAPEIAVSKLLAFSHNMGSPTAESTPLLNRPEYSNPKSLHPLTPIASTSAENISQSSKTDSIQINVENKPQIQHPEDHISHFQSNDSINTLIDVTERNSNDNIMKTALGSVKLDKNVKLSDIPLTDYNILKKYINLADATTASSLNKTASMKRHSPYKNLHKFKSPVKVRPKLINLKKKHSKLATPIRPPPEKSQHKTALENLKADAMFAANLSSSIQSQVNSTGVDNSENNYTRADSFEYLPGTIFVNKNNGDRATSDKSLKSKSDSNSICSVGSTKQYSKPQQKDMAMSSLKRSYKVDDIAKQCASNTDKNSVAQSNSSKEIVNSEGKSNGSTSSGQKSNTEKIFGDAQSATLVRDLKTSIHLLNCLVVNNTCDMDMKKRLVRKVVKRLMEANYPDDSTTDFSLSSARTGNRRSSTIESSSSSKPHASSNSIYSSHSSTSKPVPLNIPRKPNGAEVHDSKQKSKSSSQVSMKNIQEQASLNYSPKGSLKGKTSKTNSRKSETLYENAEMFNNNELPKSTGNLPDNSIKQTYTKHTKLINNNPTLSGHSTSSQHTTVSTNPSFRDWLQPLTRSEKSYEQRLLSKSQEQDILEQQQIMSNNLLKQQKLLKQDELKSESKSSLIIFAQKEKANQLAWISTEIEHLYNLKQLLMDQENTEERKITHRLINKGNYVFDSKKSQPGDKVSSVEPAIYYTVKSNVSTKSSPKQSVITQNACSHSSSLALSRPLKASDFNKNKDIPDSSSKEIPVTKSSKENVIKKQFLETYEPEPIAESINIKRKCSERNLNTATSQPSYSGWDSHGNTTKKYAEIDALEAKKYEKIERHKKRPVPPVSILPNSDEIYEKVSEAGARRRGKVINKMENSVYASCQSYSTVGSNSETSYYRKQNTNLDKRNLESESPRSSYSDKIVQTQSSSAEMINKHAKTKKIDPLKNKATKSKVSNDNQIIPDPVNLKKNNDKSSNSTTTSSLGPQQSKCNKIAMYSSWEIHLDKDIKTKHTEKHTTPKTSFSRQQAMLTVETQTTDSVVEISKVTKNDNKHCSCKLRKCICKEKHDNMKQQIPKSESKTEKRQLPTSIAYLLTFDERVASNNTSDMSCNVSLEEIKVPLPKLKNQKSFRKPVVLKSKLTKSHYTDNEKDIDTKASNDESSKENISNNIQKSDKSTVTKEHKPSLLEYLIKNKPKFVMNAEIRRQTIGEIAEMREIRNQHRSKLISLLEENVDKNKFNEMKKVLPPQPLTQKRVFTTRQIKKMTLKKCKQLPEVTEKKMYKQRENMYRNNRRIADLFNRKLQRQVLQGKTSLSNSCTVVTDFN